MKTPKKDIYTLAQNAGKGAPLQTTKSKTEGKTTRPKNVASMPIAFFEAHAELVAAGKTSLDFSRLIIEATRKEIERLKNE